MPVGSNNKYNVKKDSVEQFNKPYGMLPRNFKGNIIIGDEKVPARSKIV